MPLSRCLPVTLMLFCVYISQLGAEELSASNFIVTADTGSSALSFINVKKQKVVKSLGVETAPIALAYGDGMLASANKGANSVSLVDTKKLEVIKTVTVGLTPWSIAYGNNVFAIANFNSHTVSFISSQDLSLIKTVLVGKNPSKIIFHEDEFAVVNNGDNSVTFIDAKKLDVIETAVVGKRPQGITYGDRNYLVSHFDFSDISVNILDSISHQNLKNLPLNEPSSSVVSFGNGYYFVQSGGLISFIDGSTLEIANRKILPCKTSMGGLVPSAFGLGKFMVKNGACDEVVLYDALTSELISVLPTGKSATAIAFGKSIFAIANVLSNSVTLIDAKKNQVKNTIVVGHQPNALLFLP